jgi:membrane associated rhomboid family serine protease
VPLILFWNLVVFLLWIAWGSDGPSFMTENFLVSWSALAEGRLWVLITSVFSHNFFLHFFINMYVLNGFGPVVERALGFRAFLRFYLVAGVVSSLAHALASNFLMGQPQLPALGASGSLAGVILLFALLYPKERLLILGLIPIPALAGALLFVGLDVWGLTAQMGGHGLPIGHGAHLGGAMTGIFYYFFWVRPRLPRRPASRVIDTQDYTRL